MLNIINLQESGNDGDEDDGVILIEDDDDGEMEHSRSPAELSMDEAHGGDRKRSVVVDDDVETSTTEAHERQNIQGSLVLFQICVFTDLNSALIFPKTIKPVNKNFFSLVFTHHDLPFLVEIMSAMSVIY